MVARRRKKSIGQRGSATHGWGARKKHRGSGHRAGYGNAGLGKRGAQKKPSFFAGVKYLGKQGFVKHGLSKSTVAINLQDLDSKLDQWVREGKAKKEGGLYVVDAQQLGFTKLLGSGQIAKKVKITVGKLSSRAQERIIAAGGQVVSSSAGAKSAEASDGSS